VADEHVPPQRRLGRPPLVDRESIARAAQAVGLEDLTMRAVAEQLGVSATSLYYHVRDRDDLVRLVAEHSAARISFPEDRGQHWVQWLAEWAEQAHQAFVADPGLLEQFMNGSLGLEPMLSHLDAALGFLHQQGFSPSDALAAYSLVSSYVLGAAVADVRAARSVREGGALDDQFRALVHEGRGGPFRHLVELGPELQSPAFHDQIRTLLTGIASRRVDAPGSIADQFGGELPDRRAEAGQGPDRPSSDSSEVGECPNPCKESEDETESTTKLDRR
jgi:AcrR family transcriptional regulator